MRADGPLVAIGADGGLLPEAATEFDVGIDAESTERFGSRLSAVARKALFAQEEHDYCASFSDAPRRFAGTWCAKEAAVKALWRWVRLDPRRVVVMRANDGRASIRVPGWNADEAGVSTSVSISSHGSLAVAWVVAWGPPPALDSDPSPQRCRR
jgi:phosphopantetheine--protein transferase-like protein